MERKERPRTGQMLATDSPLLRVATPMRWTVASPHDLGCGREGFNHLLRGRIDGVASRSQLQSVRGRRETAEGDEGSPANTVSL